ncbi:MAG: hypothetical protein P8R42_20840 [Candidatus Binatia bacterium]|nr:hypothetical protein [Candidatus Binatia bacterium]
MRKFTTLLSLTLLLAGSVEAIAADQPIEGTKIVLSRTSSGKEKLVFVSTDPAIVTPASLDADDPTISGVTIDLFSNLDGASTVITIPGAATAAPAIWKDTGPDYKFVNGGAPNVVSGAKVLLLRDGKKIMLVAREVPLPLSGRNGFVTIRITMGDTRYCARFNATDVKKDYAGKFIAKKASANDIEDCTDFGLGIIDGPALPTSTEPCPTITDGTINFLGNAVRIRVSPDAALRNGPLVFAWHSLGSNPNGAISHLLGPDNMLQQILDMGGMVAAPFGHGGLTEFGHADFPVTDEIVACAMQQVGIDPFQIHSIGFSAGGLQTTLMGFERSGYIASIVGWSGGFPGNDQDPTNLVPSLLSHGGPGDFVFIPFDELMEDYYDLIVSEGHFAIMCRHGNGHSVPTAIRQRTLPFLLDHPFGTVPSPYEGGLPASFPGYCTASS